MKKIAAARTAAYSVLEDVAEGGYASDLLREATRDLSARDAGLASQLVLGSLRVQNQLDYLIERYSGRAAAALDPAVRMALRLGIYQLRYLERIPAHAVVDDGVEFVKQRQRAAAGLTNAVLRKVNRDAVEWPSEALKRACPEWLLDRWAKHFGAKRAMGIADAALRVPVPYLRLREGEAAPEGVELETTEVKGAYRVVSGAVEGVRLHDISSQSIVPLLELRAEHSFLDLCAAPGNKTMQALEAEPRVAVACDVSERRLQTVPPGRMARVVLDAAEALPFGVKFDRILIDAPCSGTGTLGRNPEIKWRLTEPDLARQRARQVAILKRGSEVLAADGRILYATCSLEREENEDVVAASEFVCEREVWRIPGRDLGDGFFAAVLRRKA